MAAGASDSNPARHARSDQLSWFQFLGQFWRLAGPYWRSEQRWKAITLTTVLIVLTVGQVVVAIALNLWSARLFDALEQRAFERFLTLIVAFVVIVGSNVAIVTTHLQVKRRLQVAWREWLTRQLVGDWMASARHYQLDQMNHLAIEHDNPDGRIAEDIRITTEYAIDIAHSALYSNLILISFVQILWQLSGELPLRIGGVEINIPGHLVWIGIVYSLLGTWVALALGQPLMRAANNRQASEADFRFGLARGRQHSLAIAVFKGEADERNRLFRLFRGAVAAWDRQTRALRNIFYYTTTWSVVSTVFPILVVAPRYIAGSITLGTLMQSAQAFQQLTTALAWPIDNLAKAADWRASVERVQGLYNALRAVDDQIAQANGHRIIVTQSERPMLALRKLSVTEADGKPVISGLSVEIGPGERVLLSGDPGATGRLFRAVAGLWPWGSGRIDLPGDAAIFFMPQRPYLPIGTLRETVSYPAAAKVPWDDGTIARALQLVGLDLLARRLDETAVWEDVLSAAEQQRLGFARLLLHRPKWVFLQEATEALDSASEQQLMELVQRELPQSTIITIGLHPALDRYHKRKLLFSRSSGGLTVAETTLPAQERQAAP